VEGSYVSAVRILQRMSTSKRSMTGGVGRVFMVMLLGDGVVDGDDGFCEGEEEDDRRHNGTDDGDEAFDSL